MTAKETSGAVPERGYNVVFEYTAAAGGYAGCRTITSFSSKKEFENNYSSGRRVREKVVAEGITDEEAQKIASDVPLESDLAACLQEASVGEKVNLNLLAMHLANVAVVRPGHGREIIDFFDKQVLSQLKN